MVGGIRKMVLQSGEVSVFEQHCVFEQDIFDVRLGSNAHIDHRPYLKGDRGPMVAVYSIAIMKGGYKSFEVMNVEDVDKVREVSRAKELDRGSLGTKRWRRRLSRNDMPRCCHCQTSARSRTTTTSPAGLTR